MDQCINPQFLRRPRTQFPANDPINSNNRLSHQQNPIKRIDKQRKKKDSGSMYRKAVTEGKSLVVPMTQSARTAKANWENRRARPPGVPGMPWMSFILPLGIAPFAASVTGGASTGCTDGWITFIVYSSLSTFLSKKQKLFFYRSQQS